ncbi:MAG: hypothetical protein AAGF11_01570 [Myxococcota bacterium]
MCLFAVDGTWSLNFNAEALGEDVSGRPVGTLESGRSNTRRFYEECAYTDNKKFYFAGPGGDGDTMLGATGNDSYQLYFSVLRAIEREVNSGNCEEIVMVGWSRGAAIISELTEGLTSLRETNSRRDPYQTQRGRRFRTLNNVIKDGELPPIKYVGLFDSVAMIQAASPVDRDWAEDIDTVKYFAHVVAGDRTMAQKGFIRINFTQPNPNVDADRSEIKLMANTTHGGVGGLDDTESAREAYDFIRNHATIAGVP